MVSWLWYHILHEFRKILNFMFVLNHFYKKGFTEKFEETTEKADDDDDEVKIVINKLNTNAFIVGWVIVTCRILVATMMMLWGTSLLIASSNKLSLVLNSLAIGIVFELDVIIAYSVIDHNTMHKIERIQPISVKSFRDTFGTGQFIDTAFSLILFMSVFFGAMGVRYVQVNSHVHQLHNAAALCLFAGPTPEGLPNVVAPVPGFCESLLSLTCAPNVTGAGSSHGPCVVTDQNIFQQESVRMYADSDLFEGMRDESGKRRSIKDWGKPLPQLVET